MKNLPYGVKILTLLLVIFGSLAIVGGIVLISPILGIIVSYAQSFVSLLSIPLDIYTIYITQLPYLFIYTICFFGLGIFTFIISIGLVQLKNWAYRLSMIISIPAVVAIVGIFMIWFLTQDDVKNSFEL